MSIWLKLNTGMECIKCSRHIFPTAARRARPLLSLPCRETRSSKSTALPQSTVNELRGSFVHATDFEVEPAEFSRQRGSNCNLNSRAVQPALFKSRRRSRKRTGARVWTERQSVRGTRGHDGD